MYPLPEGIWRWGSARGARREHVRLLYAQSARRRGGQGGGSGRRGVPRVGGRTGLRPLVAHSPYTLNPCSDKPSVRDFAKRAFTEDLERMELTPGCFYNFHPGSHVGQGTEAGSK